MGRGRALIEAALSGKLQYRRCLGGMPTRRFQCGGFPGDQPMRVLAMLALALLLAGCEGDRIKHGSMNERQAQPQSTLLT